MLLLLASRYPFSQQPQTPDSDSASPVAKPELLPSLARLVSSSPIVPKGRSACRSAFEREKREASPYQRWWREEGEVLRADRSKEQSRKRDERGGKDEESYCSKDGKCEDAGAEEERRRR